MNRKVNLGLSLAVGLLGGCLSHYLFPENVRAAQVAPPKEQVAPPKEIEARSFVLVNDDGSPAGLFGFDRQGRPDITLFDKTGKTVWSTRGNTSPKPLGVDAPN